MNNHHGSRGQVLPLVAICLVVLLGFAGMAVDVGYLQYEQRQQQTAADSGALAGAEYLLKNGGCAIAGTGWSQAAKDDSGRNGYTDGAGSVTVVPTHPVNSGPFAGDPCAVQVQVTSPHPTFFAKLFGLAGAETTEAVATISANNNGCVYFLSTTVSTDFNGPKIIAPGCSLETNNPDFTTHGGTVEVAGYGYSQSISDNGTKYPLASPVKIPPVADPCPEIVGCAALKNSPPSDSPCPSHATNTSGVLNPGCYTTDFIVNGNTTMMPGTYVITGISPSMHGTLTGSGVTIYVDTNGAAPSPHGSTIDVSAPTTGSYTGVVYYQVPSNTNGQTFDGTAITMNGLVYAPGVTDVTYNGQQRTYMVLVLGAGRFNGNKDNFTYMAPNPGQSLIQNAVLGE